VADLQGDVGCIPITGKGKGGAERERTGGEGRGGEGTDSSPPSENPRSATELG
jgi:hypothetical protein